MFVLYQASRDPETPWAARIFIFIVVLYALSPIDLIPDFIPVIGYLDDLLLIPFGLYLACKMIPHSILEKHRNQMMMDPEIKVRMETYGKWLVLSAWAIGIVLLVVLGGQSIGKERNPSG